MIFTVEVTVALTLPPRADRRFWYRIEAADGTEAELIACLWAAGHRGVLTPVAAVVLDWNEGSVVPSGSHRRAR